MSDFLDYLTNPSFIKATGKIKIGKEEFGYIYIENEQDKSFWELFFGSDIISNYEFNVSGNPESMTCGTRGKVRFDSLLKSANKHSVFALDSDIDHFTIGRFDRCNEIIENPFVIHTYGYGKESYTNSFVVLDKCLHSYSFYIKNTYNFKTFLESYSSLIYNVYIKFIYLLNENKLANEGDFNQKIIPTSVQLKDMFFLNDYASFKVSITSYEQELDEIIGDNDYLTQADYFNRFGLCSTNVYQFINGHNLEDRIINPIVNEIKCKLIKAEMKSYKGEGATGEMLKNRSGEVKNHFENNVKFSTIKTLSIEFSNCTLFKKAQEQITALVA